jgi:hypothetical protein
MEFEHKDKTRSKMYKENGSMIKLFNDALATKYFT